MQNGDEIKKSRQKKTHTPAAVITAFFIYGTMRAEEGRFKEIAPYLAQPPIPAILQQAYLYSVGAWPFVVPNAPAKFVVHGELMCIQPDILDIACAMLDGVEGYIVGDAHNIFLRKVLPVYIPSDEVYIDAYVYVAASDLERQVGKEYIKQLKHGDWRKRT